jgi:hypothetical protein
MELKRMGEPATEFVEQQIDAWRAHVRRNPTITDAATIELEDQLRGEVTALLRLGLSGEEAFLVALKRTGEVDALTREYAREHADGLWKQFVLWGDVSGDAAEAAEGKASRKMWVAIGLAVAAGIAIKAPVLFGADFDRNGPFYMLNAAFFTLPFMIAYFAWERPLASSVRAGLAAVLAIAAAVVNLFPFLDRVGFRLPDTEALIFIHLPIALWLALGVAYVGGRWRGSERRMDFVRFTGELAIYYVLIALGGGALIGLTFGLFSAIGLSAEPIVGNWIVPCGMVGATVIATWLVEAKQSIIENMAPVLARIFIPLFTIVLFAFVGTVLGTGRTFGAQREELIVVDMLLVAVFGLLLYSLSARDERAPPSLLDWTQLAMVGGALLVDVLALATMAARTTDLYGFTPNRLAALGMNLVLFVNLAGSGFLFARFLRGDAPFLRLIGWQVSYLYVIAAWAAVVAFLFPLLFGFR